MDTHAITIKATPPRLYSQFCPGGSNGTCQDLTIPRFDTINNVLLYPYYTGAETAPTLFIYHPDTDTWEIDPMYQPEGRRVRGNHSTFDPVNNVLMIYGGLCGGDAGCGGPGNIGNPDPTLSHFFLYRYGNGAGSVKPPNPPTSLIFVR